MPFTGELMSCVICGRQERSNPRVSSGWRMLQLDEHGFYVCPDELPKEGASAAEYSKAYQVAIAVCVSEILKREGKETPKEIEDYKSAVVKFRANKEQEKGHGFQRRRAEN